MDYNSLYEQIKLKGSFLCVGLDTDTGKIPEFLKTAEDPIFEFNKAIIDATAPYCIAYKPNLAFYEAEGAEGIEALEKTVQYIRKKYPEMFIIADAKRGDIGNTAKLYARAFFERMDFDAVTLAPYMGFDSIDPFMKYEGRWGIILAMTSNASAEDFETAELSSGMPLYEKIIKGNIEKCEQSYGDSKGRIMFVVGATRPEKLAEIRKYCPEHFLLVPGVGAQGGSLKEVAKAGLNSHCGLIVNSSRGIIYASSGEDFAEQAGKKAAAMACEMRKHIKQ